jgi:chitinase
MKKFLQIFFITSIALFVFNKLAVPQQKIVGYYTSWSNLPAVNQMEFKNLTHVIQAFAYPDTNGSISLPSGIPNPGLITAVHNAKEKILISFQNDSTNGFSAIATDSSLRAVFISNLIQFLSTYHYDGIDIDWEYPTSRQGGQLTELVKELRQKFNLTDSTWLITMAVPPTAANAQGYQYSSMLPYIDWFSIMGYNFNGSWSALTGHNAPLYSSPRHNEGDDSSSVQYMNITRQIPSSKLLLGVPFYGVEFNSKGLYQSFSDTVTDPTYADIVDLVSARHWNYIWDSVSEVPYYTSKDSTKFISFDDTVSIRLKTEFSISHKLGGIMIWALDQDFVNNRQPLLETIAQTIRSNTTALAYGGQTNRSVISGFYLYNNYPNPFNPSTTISWQLAAGSFVTLKVYDILGNEVATLVREFQTEGVHSISFEPQQVTNHRQLSSGVYFYRLQAGSFISTKKLMYLK